MSVAISVRDLIFEYTRSDEQSGEEKIFRAIDGVSFDIEDGSFVAIVGRNGSGKSTLAKNLNGLLVPTSGTVTAYDMDTKDDDRIWDIRSNVGMVFQNPDNQIVSSIVEDDVAFGPENLGVDPEEIRERVDEALRSVDMYNERLKGPHMLSGGQKQRIAIAGAIAMRPRCIIFDEPTAMLDPKGRSQVMSIIKKLNDESMTAILITHFMDEAAQAGRIIAMKDGKICSDGKPGELFADRTAIAEAGLELPTVVELRERLREQGFDIPDDVLTEEELVDHICR